MAGEHVNLMGIPTSTAPVDGLPWDGFWGGEALEVWVSVENEASRWQNSRLHNGSIHVVTKARCYVN